MARRSHGGPRGRRRGRSALALALLLGAALPRSAAAASPAEPPPDGPDPAAAPVEDDLPGPALPPGPAPGRAPDARRLPRAEYLERDYLFYDLPNVGPVHDAPLLFEAQVAPHLFVVNELAKVERQTFRGDEWLFTFATTFVLRLRMVTDHSAPVRPPSYMPRFDLQAFRYWKPDRRRVRMLELRLTPWGHHSNGQQFCTFLEGPPSGLPGSQPCLPVDRRNPPTDKVNYRSGDFSTSYFIAGGHHAWIELDEDDRERFRLGVGALFEGNPRGWGPGAPSADTYALYGPWRAELQLDARWHLDDLWGCRALAGELTAAGSAQVMWKTAPGIPGDRETVEVRLVPDRWGGMGAFVRVVSGQDYLNVLYAAGRVGMLQLGILWDLSPRVQYAFEPAGR